MYSGMAARTAQAIGLPNERPGSFEGRLAVASRTWWCIYAHEVYVDRYVSSSPQLTKSGRCAVLLDGILY